MKKLLFVLLTIFVLIVGAVVILPKLVSMESIAGEVKAQVKQATGRDLGFSGVSLVFWPNLGVELQQVTLSNPAWAQEKTMAAIGKADVMLALKPLLQRRIEIKKFILDEPVIHLEVAHDGKRSWDFATENKAAPAAAGGASGGMPQGFNFQFGQMQIGKGKLTFNDRQKGTAASVEDIETEVKFRDLTSPLEVKGSLTYKQKHVEFTIDADKPVDFLNGKTSPGRATLKTDDLTAKLEGVLATQGTMLNGNIDATVTSLSKLAAWLGDGKEQKTPFEKISFTSGAQLTKSDMILKGAVLTLDDVQAKGNLNVGFAGKPDIFARLSLNKLNLDRFTGGAAAGEAGGKKAADEGWDTTPLDFSALNSVNADLELKTEGFAVKGVDVGPSTLIVHLRDGNLHFKSSEASLFDGKFSSDLTVNAAATPKMAFSFNMSGVQAKPVLTTFADFKKLSGTAEANVSVTATGNSQKALVSSLDGKGSVMFRDGALEGIDLVNIAKMVQKRLTDVGVGAGKTDFVELGGTFTISNGVATNTDLKMKGPLLQATGQGTIDLPQKYIKYRVIPVLTASSATEGATGLAIPVDIKGPFSNIKVQPDFAGAVQDIINNPEAAKQTIKNIRDQGRDIHGNLKDLKKDPAKALEGLLGGGGIFGKPAPETAPEAAPAPETAPLPETAPEATPAPAP